MSTNVNAVYLLIFNIFTQFESFMVRECNIVFITKQKTH